MEEVKSSTDIITGLEEKLNKARQEINELKEKVRDCKEEYKTSISFQIAQLRATQMLFDVMKSGSTHNQKSLFAFMSKNSIDGEIGKLIDRYQNIKWKFRIDGEKDSELPF
jgi:hypothetical protein